MKARNGIAIAAGAVALAATAAGCGGSSHSAAPAGGVKGARHTTASTMVESAKVKGLGKVLVDSRGLTLYTFAPDKAKRVTCKGSCASVWPPLKLSGKKASAGTGVKASLLGADRSPAGGKVVTYKHWPLYTYVGDTKAGEAKGQALKANGGYWYVISPTGKVIKTKLGGGGGGGGGGWG